MRTVKISFNGPAEAISRQFPGGVPELKGYRFEINNDVDECDAWVVYSKGADFKRAVRVKRSNVGLIVGEPRTIYKYAKGYRNQFGFMLSHDASLSSKNTITSHPMQPWWVGRRNGFKAGRNDFPLNFDDLVTAQPDKTKFAAVIASNKVLSKGHQQRLDFVKLLNQTFGDKIHIYGRGFRDFEDKWDLLHSYKYHLVLENSRFENYWTEKLADAYLAGCYPIYYGAPNIKDFFEKDMITEIDIAKPANAILEINKIFEGEIWEKRYTELAEAKRRILYDYNISEELVRICDTLDFSGHKENVKLKSDLSFIDHGKVNMLAGRFFHRLRHQF